MPNFDGTGPRGLGPLTGRGRGFCVSTRKPNSRNLNFRPNFRPLDPRRGFNYPCGLGRGLPPCGGGRGFGRRNWG